MPLGDLAQYMRKQYVYILDEGLVMVKLGRHGYICHKWH